nr:monoacylglycerol lipase ABHD6 isoform X2 [Labrus bergylta]
MNINVSLEHLAVFTQCNLQCPLRGAAMELVMLSGGVLVVPVLAFITSFLFWPGALLKVYNWYWRQRLGLVVRYSHSGSYRFCYSSRGKPGGATPSLLLLHGFSATKDMWLPVVKYFPKNQHVVCVDMPGHEGTSRTGLEDYSIQGQVGRIHQFVQSIGLDKRPFHLIGTSMGGNVAGVYAAHHPADLCSVTLICPAGLVYPTETEFISRLRELEKSEQEESIPLIPSTPQELDDMLRLCCYTPINLPRQVLRVFFKTGSQTTVSIKKCSWRSLGRSLVTHCRKTCISSKRRCRSSGGKRTRWWTCQGRRCCRKRCLTVRWSC